MDKQKRGSQTLSGVGVLCLRQGGVTEAQAYFPSDMHEKERLSRLHLDPLKCFRELRSPIGDFLRLRLQVHRDPGEGACVWGSITLSWLRWQPA